MTQKVSRHVWPAAREDRLRLIVANLRIRVPVGKWKGKSRPNKDELEELEEEESTNDGNE